MPQQRLRLGVIGFAKGHVKGIMGHFAGRPQVEWVAFADVPPAVPEQWHHRSSRTDNMRIAREEIRIPTYHEDWRQLLDRERLDLVIFCCENAQDGEVVEAIAATARTWSPRSRWARPCPRRCAWRARRGSTASSCS